MAKMKALQPEQARLRELHKDDKMALQKATMSLFKREKVNPMSGCLPILVQIPVNSNGSVVTKFIRYFFL